MKFLVMYKKGATLGNDTIVVRYQKLSSGGQPEGNEEYEVSENVAGGATLSDKKFDTVQASFESTQSVTRVPGLPDRKAKIRDIKICTAENATKIDPSSHKIEPSDEFEWISLQKGDLEIKAVNNVGKDIKWKWDDNFSHYRISLDEPKIDEPNHDLLLWDKYHWMTPDSNPLIRKSPYLTNPPNLWEK